jgi:capsular exopolysaccharide synthesis family protein
LELKSRSERGKYRRWNLITYLKQDSKVSEQFRTIRANIKFLSENKEKKIFVVTSPSFGEGKSAIIANLAASIAQQDGKVLLIDVNLKNPVIHEIFKLRNEQGLIDFLTYRVRYEDCIQKSTIKNLSILTIGSNLGNSSDLLSNEKMVELLKLVSKDYDIVLLDSSPVLEATETRLLANQCDGVILVVHRGKTKMEKVFESKRLLDLAHANILGAIINDK